MSRTVSGANLQDRPLFVRRYPLWFLVMSRRTIVRSGHSSLRTPAQPVTAVDQSVSGLMDDLTETLRTARGLGLVPALGLATNQVNVPGRVIAVQTRSATMALANPEIVERSGTILSFEGCLSLSLRDMRIVRRSRRVRVKALDRTGQAVDIVARGQDAAILQHEIDHLDGVLLTDRRKTYRSHALWGVA
jgi:peptide deformylase